MPQVFFPSDGISSPQLRHAAKPWARSRSVVSLLLGGLFLLLYSSRAIAQIDVDCNTEQNPLLDSYDFGPRDTVRALMVWAGVWDSTRNVAAYCGEDSIYWRPWQQAPQWYQWFFDPDQEQSLHAAACVFTCPARESPIAWVLRKI